MKAYSYIRFSTPEQLKGDSLRRQLEAGEKYAKENGLILDKSLSMQDLGLSAYHGVHRTKGALGKFLKLVEAGQIEKGSVLIVENLDRLSREDVLDALNQFTGIIQAGISIVTLQDGQKYDVASIKQNWAQLIISITYMARANEESLAKSKRLKAVWKNKRQKATTDNTSKITNKLPYWIKSVEGEFVLVPEICRAIEAIYRFKAEGKGSNYIEKQINQMADIWKPPQSKRNETGGWRTSYINRLLINNRALIGEFQPYQLIEGKRVKVGEPIPGYYPKAIDDQLFYQVQAIIKRNSKEPGKGGGQTGKGGNIFTGVIKCGLCGFPMHLIDKGENCIYLHCDKARRKIQTDPCHAKPVRYSEVEKAFFKDFDEFDVTEFIPDKDKKLIAINNLQKRIEANKYQIGENERKRGNLLEAIANENDVEERAIFQNNRAALKQENEWLSAENSKLQFELMELKRNGKEMKANIDTLLQINSILNQPEISEEKRIENRLRLRGQIKNLISEIVVHPLQKDFVPLQEIEPGIVQWMHSKRIERIEISFKGLKKKRILRFAGYSEVQ
jgi:DNA invertase Pin-like site-specific DNA recombinase